MSEQKALDGFTVVAELHFTDEAIRNLLVSAFEGGSNYWYMIERSDYGPLGEKVLDTAIDESLRDEYKDMDHYLLPFITGCGLVISNRQAEEGEDVKEHRLDRAALGRGLSLMPHKYTHHWRDFVEENSDAITADVFLQLCLFGDVIYG